MTKFNIVFLFAASVSLAQGKFKIVTVGSGLEKLKTKSGHLANILQHDFDLCEAEIFSISRLINTI